MKGVRVTKERLFLKLISLLRRSFHTCAILHGNTSFQIKLWRPRPNYLHLQRSSNKITTICNSWGDTNVCICISPMNCIHSF